MNQSGSLVLAQNSMINPTKYSFSIQLHTLNVSKINTQYGIEKQRSQELLSSVWVKLHKILTVKKLTKLHPVLYMIQIFHCSNLSYNLQLQMNRIITEQDIPLILILWSKSRTKSE